MRPEQCAECQAVGSLMGHGWYHRKPKDKQRVYSIWIKRWKCKACGHTLSCLPSFLLAQRHYLVESIQEILSTRFEAARSWVEVEAGCTNQGIPDLRTMQRWCRSFIQQARGWLAAVQATLAQQESGSAWLDPHGGGAGGANPACAPPPAASGSNSSGAIRP